MTTATSSTTKNPAPAGQPAQNRPAGPMLAGRQADSARRRQRVIATLNRAASAGQEISVSAIARAALFTERSREFQQFNGLAAVSVGTFSGHDRRW